MRATVEPTPIHDFWLRVLLSPLIGAFIGRTAGLVDHARHTVPALAGHYAVFACVAFLIWEGNRRLYFRSRRRAPSFERPWRRMLRMGGVLALFTVPVSAALLLLWRRWSAEAAATDSAITLAVLMATLGVAIITHGYETVFLRREWEAERIRATALERARLVAELDHLQRETSPHFLFNALNSALHLIESDTARAVCYVEALAGHYRHVLDTRDRALVPLAEELDALERFRPLVDIRFGGAVRVDVLVGPREARAWRVPPLSVQELLENAIKHNDVQGATPLEVRLECLGDELVVSNRVVPTTDARVSTRRGLANLSQRLELTVGRPASWGREGDRFVVRVPLAPAEVVEVTRRPSA